MKFRPQTKGQWLRLALLSLIAVLLFSYEFVLPFIGFIEYEPHSGDILFQPLHSNELIDAIEGATHSPYSHCGVVLKKEGRWVVIQALGTVHCTPLYWWIVQGRFGKFAVYRLKPDYASAIPRFIVELEKFMGLAYDYHYEMGDDAIYCSELVYKAYKNATGAEMGALVELGQLDWAPFAELIRRHEGGNLPLHRVMITPRHLSEAPQLVKVFSFGID
jgi:hypothetical protein